MTHPILDKIDDLDDAIGNSADLPMDRANSLRISLSGLKREAHALLTAAPGDEERAMQAQEQGDEDRGGYLPARRNAEG